MGQALKGVIIMLSCILFGVITYGIGAFIICIMSAIDAYCIATKINAGHRVGAWEFF